MNNPLILFRFHDSLAICRERIKLLRALNPGVPVYGVYGGPAEGFELAHSALGDLLADLQITEQHEPFWHWLHMDLDVKHWFRKVGRSVEFDFLFDHEWDLLTTDALTTIFPDIGQDAIALCSLTELTPDVEDTWRWTSWPEHRPDYERFVDYMSKTFGMGPLRYVSHGPGTLLSRSFLERFAEVEDVEMVISEIKYPAFAQVLGFDVVNNKFRTGPLTDHGEDAYFNSDDKPIAFARVVSELVKPGGRRAFHPVKYQFTLSQLRALVWRGESAGEDDASRSAASEQLEAALDRETELRALLAQARSGEAELRALLAQARSGEAELLAALAELRAALAERDASLQAIQRTRAWRLVTKWWELKRRLSR